MSNWASCMPEDALYRPINWMWGSDHNAPDLSGLASWRSLKGSIDGCGGRSYNCTHRVWRRALQEHGEILGPCLGFSCLGKHQRFAEHNTCVVAPLELDALWITPTLSRVLQERRLSVSAQHIPVCNHMHE